jgi:hypothetical protein
VRVAILNSYHQGRREAILRSWNGDLQRLGNERANLLSSRITSAIEAARSAGQPALNQAPPKAVAAAERAVAERPLLRFANFGGKWLEKGMDEELWQAIANLHRSDTQVDESSIALMRQEFSSAPAAGRLSDANRQGEDPLMSMVRTFEDSMALDAVRNEYLLHRRVHELLAKRGSASLDFDTLNEWVYAQLFLTPCRDPWLGLAPSDVYTALDNGGLIEPNAQAANPRGG